MRAQPGDPFQQVACEPGMRRQSPGDGRRQRDSFKLDAAASKEAIYLTSLHPLYIGVEGIVYVIVVPDNNTIWFHDAYHL